MIAQPNVKAGERTVTVLWANSWGFNVLAFGLLIDIMYRRWIFHESAWDLFALLGISGVVSTVYAARHKIQLFGSKSIIIMALGALVAFIIAAVIAVTKAM